MSTTAMALLTLGWIGLVALVSMLTGYVMGAGRLPFTRRRKR